MRCCLSILPRLVSSLTLPLHIDIELIQCQNYNKLCVHGKQKLITAAAATTMESCLLFITRKQHLILIAFKLLLAILEVTMRDYRIMW